MKRVLLPILVIGILLLSACAAPSAPPAEAPPTPPPTEEPAPPAEALPTPPPIEQQMYTLVTSVKPSGAGSVSPSGGQYEPGIQVTLTATPASGYVFDHWSGDASGTSLTTTVTMDSDKSVGAHFTATATTEWMTPISAVASGYTVWGGTWYTGPPSLSIDGNKITAWTLNDMGEITFDLGGERLVAGIEAYWGGHVTNGNTVNVYVDGVQVLNNEQFGATSNIRYFTAVRGRFIKYQTVALPHNEYLQIATWSEIAEFRVLVEVK